MLHPLVCTDGALLALKFPGEKTRVGVAAGRLGPPSGLAAGVAGQCLFFMQVVTHMDSPPFIPLSSRLKYLLDVEIGSHAALLTSRVRREGCLPDCHSGRQSDVLRKRSAICAICARGSLAASTGILAAGIELLVGLAKQTLRHDRRERDRRREANGRSGLVRHVGDARCAYVLGVGARLYADALQQACEHTKRIEIGTTCPRARQP